MGCAQRIRPNRGNRGIPVGAPIDLSAPENGTSVRVWPLRAQNGAGWFRGRGRSRNSSSRSYGHPMGWPESAARFARCAIRRASGCGSPAPRRSTGADTAAREAARVADLPVPGRPSRQDKRSVGVYVDLERRFPESPLNGIILLKHTTDAAAGANSKATSVHR